ncbi:E3 ubiquitin-protein ligase RNF168 isoform 1-T4 [Anomaloglossus baeobatrachus]|uniref:E3 ubiquitin-protein ligase RNF168 n=1 Tax=Anomaloglossus baeobatrachus TaxID=238106 RepID=UPI003F4F60F1
MSKKIKRPLPRSECFCGICREILLEPVTLPCSHILCHPCFQSTVEKASLCCPYCRLRVSNWARKNARANTLVNKELWEIIQKQYPAECERRARGQDTAEDDIEDASYPARLLCKPGEIRKEYEAEISKIEAERLDREAEEHRASEEYIRKLLAEEEEEQRLHLENAQEQLDQQLKRDEELAWMISSDLNEFATSDQSSVIEVPMVSRKTPISKPSKNLKTKAKQSGDIERFLSPKANGRFHIASSTEIQNEHLKSINTSLGSPACVSDSDEDSMPSLSPQFNFHVNGREMGVFDTELRIPCLDACSPIDVDCTDFKAVSSSGSSDAEIKATQKIPSNMAAKDFSLPSSSVDQGDCGQRSYSESSNVASAKTVAKRTLEFPLALDCHATEKRQKVFCLEDSLAEGLHTERLMELEKSLTERKIQEEQDRLLALKLQKLLDKEEKNMNRSKGSPDEYKLRPKRTTTQESSEVTSMKKNLLSESTGSGDTSDENKQPVPKKQTQQTRTRGRHASSKTQPSEVLRPSNKQQTILDMFQRSAAK